MMLFVHRNAHGPLALQEAIGESTCCRRFLFILETAEVLAAHWNTVPASNEVYVCSKIWKTDHRGRGKNGREPEVRAI